MYTAIVLNEEDRSKIWAALWNAVPPWWIGVCDHMTINLQSAADGPCAGRVGEEAVLTVKGFAIDDRVAAVQVETDIPSVNAVKHVTVAVNTDGGGKPRHSNELKGWKPISEFQVRGVIREVR